MKTGFSVCLGLFAVFLFAQTNVVQGQPIVYCYWGTWSHYRTGNGNFEASNIDTSLCTHIGYAFFGLGTDDKIKSLDTWLDDDLKNVANTIALKQKNPNLKVLASIGGWNQGSINYSAMASTAARRATFISSVIELLLKYGFDGLDCDWEYPAQRGGSPNDVANFVSLLSELKTALKARGLILTIAVGAAESSASISYDIPNVAKHVDFILVMSYDFAVAADGKAGFNAPLQGQGKNNVKAAVSYWLKSGAPANKIVVGLAAYGRSFTLKNSSQHTPGSLTIGGGNPGPFTKEGGFLSYYEICENLKAGWTRHFDKTTLVPYAFNGTQWVGYDDKESLRYKLKYIKSLKLAGGMIWSIESDDFRGLCGEKYPLLKTINQGLKNY